MNASGQPAVLDLSRCVQSAEGLVCEAEQILTAKPRPVVVTTVVAAVGAAIALVKVFQGIFKKKAYTGIKAREAAYMHQLMAYHDDWRPDNTLRRLLRRLSGKAQKGNSLKGWRNVLRAVERDDQAAGGHRNAAAREVVDAIYKFWDDSGLASRITTAAGADRGAALALTAAVIPILIGKGFPANAMNRYQG